MPETYRGTVRNGVVVFDSPAPLAEGTAVRVEPVPAEAPQPTPGTGPLCHFHPVGAGEAPPGELDRLMEDVQRPLGADPESGRDKWK